MATTARTLGQQQRRSTTQPIRRTSQAPTRLKVLDKEDLKRRQSRRHTRYVVLLGAGVVTAALLVIAVSQALVASQQVRLDQLHQQLTSAVAKNENLQLNKAQLATPSRIMKIAEHKLGMITPVNVGYLSPVNPGPTLGERSASVSK